MSINRLQNGVTEFYETLYDVTDIINDGGLHGLWSRRSTTKLLRLYEHCN